jgi:hypothetical protein
LNGPLLLDGFANQVQQFRFKIVLMIKRAQAVMAIACEADFKTFNIYPDAQEDAVMGDLHRQLPAFATVNDGDQIMFRIHFETF